MFNKFKNSINQNLNKFFIKENHEGKMVYELLHIYIYNTYHLQTVVIL